MKQYIITNMYIFLTYIDGMQTKLYCEALEKN